MDRTIEHLTPREIVAELDRYIVGQAAAKRAVAVALRNRYRRQQVPVEHRNDILPKNILMMGPTGVGKTEIARRLAQLARAPFIKVEATKFTEVGYVGRDVDAMVRDLVAEAVRLVEKERFTAIQPEAETRTVDRLIELLDTEGSASHWGTWAVDEDEDPEERWARERADTEARREAVRQKLLNGELENELIEFDSEEATNPFVQVFSAQGIEEMGIESGMPFGSKRVTRRTTVAEARETLLEEECRKLVDKSTINRDAVQRAEQMGIIFIDEIDKVAIKSSGGGPDVSREGVQRDLLPIIEGATVATKFGPCKTDHVLFIAAGAFHIAKPSDLIPELQGRLPIRVELEPLGLTDFRRILSEPKNSLTKQYELLLAADGVEIEWSSGALDEIASFAAAENEKVDSIGARRLHTVMENVLQEILFDAPFEQPQKMLIDENFVKNRLNTLVKHGETNRLS